VPGNFDAGTVNALSPDTDASASAAFVTDARVSAVVITPSEQSATAAPGESVEYIYIISNTGTDDDVYNLETISTWPSSVSPESIQIEVGASKEITVTHTVPADVHDDDYDSGALITTPQYEASVSATVTFSTVADIIIAPPTVISIEPVEWWTESQGDDEDLWLKLTLVDEQGGIVSDVTLEGSLTHDSGQYWSLSGITDDNGEVTFSLTAAAAGHYEVVVDSLTRDDHEWDGVQPHNNTFEQEEPRIALVSVSPDDLSERGWPEEDIIYVFTVENTGNVGDTYEISVTSDWASSVMPQSLTLEPGESSTVTVAHSVPEAVTPGELDTGTVNIASTETGASASAAFTTTARVSALEITPRQQSNTAPLGETVEYTYIVSNTGTEDEVYDLTVVSAWDASPDASFIVVAAGQSATVVVSHTVPEDSNGSDTDAGTLIAACARASADATFATTAEEPDEPAAPVIDLFSITSTSNRIWTRVIVEWAVSDEDGDLASVQIVIKADGSVVDSAFFSVSGQEASGRYQWRNRGGHGQTYEVTLTVTDSMGNTTTQTQSINL